MRGGLASITLGHIRCYQAPKGRRFRAALCVCAVVAGVMMIDLTAAAHAQSLTPDPGAWRPMPYANLQTAAPQTATYLDIWKDAVEANNRAYKRVAISASQTETLL